MAKNSKRIEVTDLPGRYLPPPFRLHLKDRPGALVRSSPLSRRHALCGLGSGSGGTRTIGKVEASKERFSIARHPMPSSACSRNNLLQAESPRPNPNPQNVRCNRVDSQPRALDPARPRAIFPAKAG